MHIRVNSKKSVYNTSLKACISIYVALCLSIPFNSCSTPSLITKLGHTQHQDAACAGYFRCYLKKRHKNADLLHKHYALTGSNNCLLVCIRDATGPP